MTHSSISSDCITRASGSPCLSHHFCSISAFLCTSPLLLCLRLGAAGPQFDELVLNLTGHWDQMYIVYRYKTKKKEYERVCEAQRLDFFL